MQKFQGNRDIFTGVRARADDQTNRNHKQILTLLESFKNDAVYKNLKKNRKLKNNLLL